VVKRSTDRILTTHVGALLRPPELEELVRAKQARQPYDTQAYESRLRSAVADVVRRQVECGIDVIDDGEYGKTGGWIGYVNERLGGFQARPLKPGERSAMQSSCDWQEFADFYADAQARGFLFPGNPPPPPAGTPPAGGGMTQECVAPVTYTGQAILQRDVANLQAALSGVQAAEAFLPVIAPMSLEPTHRNAYYKTQEDYVWALAEAMREEYETIAGSGIILQVDDAWLPALWERMVDELGEDGYYKFCEMRIEALNGAFVNIPEDQIRYHVCWGSWHGPHAFDMPMAKVIPLLLKVKAQAYLFEAGNVRHEHEYRDWEKVKVPAGKILIPGVVSHATNAIEHPELVADRIMRYAAIAGRENVMAGTDCGMGNRIHRQLAWAKFQAMAEGARIASKRLWAD
jgi:5-methyltetrahydropteroyltriglutamate--homocysteine methyltransferase